jgi:hypothetical protein
MRMINKYIVNLINEQGCRFDHCFFTNLKQARRWAAHRGGNYRVDIYVNGEQYPSISYKARS